MPLVCIDVVIAPASKRRLSLQVMATICCGFLSFFLAEKEVMTSGVITVVSAGRAPGGASEPRRGSDACASADLFSVLFATRAQGQTCAIA